MSKKTSPKKKIKTTIFEEGESSTYKVTQTTENDKTSVKIKAIGNTWADHVYGRNLAKIEYDHDSGEVILTTNNDREGEESFRTNILELAQIRMLLEIWNRNSQKFDRPLVFEPVKYRSKKVKP